MTNRPLRTILALALALTAAAASAQDIQEKELYSTNFTEWGAYATKATKAETTAEWKTRYSNETLTFTIYNAQIDNYNFNEGKFPTWTGGFIMCAKASDPYIITSPLASITKVHFMHGATGSNRGYQLWAKGDGDNDWVSISDAVASTATGTEVTANVNRTNCQLKFTNLNAAQNAYLMQLDIYGNVDMSASPMLATFKANGTTYTAGDLFEATDEGTMAATIELSNSETMISDENPLADIVADNGTVGQVSYETIDGGGVKATIPIVLGSITLNYEATFVFKPYYTVTFIDAQGNEIEAVERQVEKDATLGATPAYTLAIADGQTFRGWYAEPDGGRKATSNDIITESISLYAMVNDVETASATARYAYNLTDKYFYAEDHEAFQPTGSAAYHDGTHGWAFAAGDSLKLLVGGKAYIILGNCAYSGDGATITLSDPDGTAVQTVEAKASTDGDPAALEYNGEAGTIALTFSGTTYLHKVTINNTEENPIAENEQGYYMVKANDATNLLATLDIASANASASKRTMIFLPNGTYHLGETTLTPISGDNISIIGQSADSTIIVNEPPVANEGIGTTATLLITGDNTYMQDLTLQNALDYYAAGSAGRAVCLQDKGTRTVCKNVTMLSYQDTYYSDNKAGQYYWEDSEIHGTVDYICGRGDAYFKRCTLVNESRSANGKSGSATIAAPHTENTEWGYVFDSCTVDNNAASFNFGRAWGGTPRLAYLNTTLLQPTEIASSRFTAAGMNNAADRFVEYNSMDESGNVVSPSSNIVSFTKDATVNTFETILTPEQAERYALDSVFTTWAPDELAAQLSVPSVAISGATLSWQAVPGAKAYAIYSGSTLEAMTTATTYTTTNANTADYTVRAANAMGGFGPATKATQAPTAINQANASAKTIKTEAINFGGQSATSGPRIVVSTLDNGQRQTVKTAR